MSENELRIGNYIHDPKGNVIEVSATLFVADMDPEGSWSIEDCNGISLTEEWCEKLGMFKDEILAQTGLAIGWSKDGISLLFDSNGGMTFDEVALPHIKYVHQLQNLFYSLTGQELTVKEIV